MTKLWKCSKGRDKTKIRNLKVPYRTEHRDVKHPRIEVKPMGDVLIVLPLDISNAEEILEENRDWLYRKISSIENMIKEFDVSEKELEEKMILFGDIYDLKIKNGTYNIMIENSTIELSTPRDVNGLVHFKNWLKKDLRNRLTNFSKTLVDQLEVEYNGIFIRSQKTKWASCSSKGNLSFNLRAEILPNDLLKHLVLHELVHLRESRHNQEFWKLIEKYHPDYEEREKSLVGYWFLAHRNELWNELIEK